MSNNSSSVTGVGSRGTRISSRRGSINESHLPATKSALPSSAEVRKIDSIPFWQENKTKDRKRRAKVASLMKGRKKYKWKGLTIEEEHHMKSMLSRCENSPLKRSSPRKLSPRKSILSEIKDSSNLFGANVSDIEVNVESKHSAESTSLDYAKCEMLNSYDSHISSVYPDCLPSSSFEDDNSLIPNNIDLFLEMGVDNGPEGVKPKSSKEKAKRRSNSFIPVANKYLKEQNNHSAANDSIDQVILDTTEMYKASSINTCSDGSMEHDKENISQYTPKATNNESKRQNTLGESPNFAEFESDEAANSQKCESSILHLDDYNLQQVQEADRLLGGFLDSSVCKSRSVSPIFDDNTLKKTKRTSKKVTSVRRSSRLFRDHSVKHNKTGSIYVKV